MNKRIRELMLKADYVAPELAPRAIKLVELLVEDFIGILEHELQLEHQRKANAFNEFDRRWHEGKITHFTKLLKQTKERYDNN